MQEREEPMTYTTFAQLRGELERSALLDTATAAGCGLRVLAARTPADPSRPVYHFVHCQAHADAVASTAMYGGPAVVATVATVPIADLLGAAPGQFCRQCQHLLLRGMSSPRTLNSPSWSALLMLARSAALSRAAQRLAAAPDSTRTPGRAAKLCAQMDQAAPWLEFAVLRAASPALAAAHVLVLAACAAAAAALAAAVASPAQRERVQARVRAEMVTPALAHLDALDTSAVLFGIFPHWGAWTAEATEVIDTFTVVSSEQHVVLSCPRFVADYISRCYAARPKDGWPAMVAVPAAHLSPAAVRSAAALWSPMAHLPLASLAVAVQAAQLLEALPVGNHQPALVPDPVAATVLP